jgi:uncharacterized protein YecE (DUF72 family)
VRHGVREILVGTSGWAYDDWVGPVYPRGLDRSRWLNRYADRFPTVEVNSTHYRVPGEDQAETMARRLHDAGLRSVTWKLPRAITHRAVPERDPGDARRRTRGFLAALEPAREADVLDALLAQFAHDTEPEAVLEGLDAILEADPPAPVFVEVRHAGFNEDRHLEPLFERARSTGGNVVATDSPAATITRAPPGEVAYFRFHGRNEETWFEEDPPGEHGKARYDHAYTDAALDQLAERLREAEADTVVAYFNNHAGGKAVRDASRLMHRLGLEPPEERVTLDDF